MNAEEPTHLSDRDRLALVFRIVGALSGFAVISWASATANWSNGWIQALFALVTVGGAAAYHLLTSMVRCPSCGGGIANFRIGVAEAKHKLFLCRRCGSTAWLAEGFYWQRDING